MPTTRHGHRLWIELALVALVVALVLLARYSSPASQQLLNNMELRFLDLRFKARGPRSPADVQALAQRVTIVGLDDSATNKYSRVLPRTVHAKLVKQLKQAGARAVIFDILFTDPGLDPAADKLFGIESAAAGNVFLPLDDASAKATPPELLKQLEAKLAYPLEAPRTAKTPRLRPPIEPLFVAMRGGGHVATKSDADGKFRKAILLRESGAVYPHAALDAVVRTVWGLSPQDGPAEDRPRWNGDYFEIGSGKDLHRIGPLVKQAGNEYNAAGEITERTSTEWMLPLNFIGGHEVMEELTVPYLDALEGRVNHRLKGRIVIVGETANGTPDLRPSPFDRQKIFFGVETNATFIANLLENNFLRPAPLWLAIVATIMCALVAGFGAANLKPGSAFVVVVAVALLYGFTCVWLFASRTLVVEMTAPLLAILVAYFALTAYRLVFTDREAREYEEALRESQEILGLHVNPRIAQELRDNPETRMAMQIGTRRDVTVLFSDIRSFTAWSEKQIPEEVKARLDEYFPTMCEIASDEYDGYIDKFIGDELMVLWNAHKDDPNHAERAVRTALSMQRALNVLNDGWRRQNQEEFRIGIGIATGPVVFGSFGSPKHKLMPTAIGDTVNLASRLESMTKETGSPIIISAATYEAIAEIVEVKPLGSIPVRGKSEAQAMYEVTGMRKG